MIRRALLAGIAGFFLIPIVVALGALAVGHIAGACGAGSSGGCEMGAASLAVFSAVPGAVIGATIPIVRSLLARRP